MESGGLQKAEGFSAARIQNSYPYGSPENVATGKANAFPTEGGPAILEIDVPEIHCPERRI
jgi:hypothetical protein